MKLSFHGGAREVTGACYLLEAAEQKFLIDCGLFQGCDVCSDMNERPFKFDSKSINAVFVTHAHVDHVGRIPKLVKHGFSGVIYSTPPTKDLARHLLEDALSLSERQNNRLYAEEDLEKAFRIWRTVSYGEKIALNGAEIIFHDAGHILGSSLIEINAEGKKFLFSGDLGNVPSVLLPPPAKVGGVEYLVVESAYGNREHEAPAERTLQLERAMEDVASRRGTLLIPAFATERTQDLLFLINEMVNFKRVPEMPVFVDSPLASRVTSVYEEYPAYYGQGIQDLYLKHPNLFKFKKLKFTESVEESKAINDVSPPKVVIAGSGMMQGGRILHHARRYLRDKNSILMVVGYQASGSLGRRLLDGARNVKIFKEDVAVSAEIRKINGFSAHADSSQLFSFVSPMRDTLKRVFVVQGESSQALHFMQEIRDRLGIQSDAPLLGDEFEV
ncbi:MAG: MBL fold metallo-hydrolase [Candidatus Sungbacteria bacterium]|nr:MBL fold metallo-hydrolase [Candidatus Sungbacteria bacterium]